MVTMFCRTVTIIFWIGCFWETAFAQFFPVLKSQHFFGNNTHEKAFRLIEGPDGLYIAGIVQKEEGHLDGFIMKVNFLGKLIWSKDFGGLGNDEIRDIALSPDKKELYFVGVIGSNINHTENADLPFKADYYIGKLSAVDGRLIWSKTLGGSDPDQAFTIGTDPKGCIIGGSSWSTDLDVVCKPGTLNNGWLISINKTGSLNKNLCFGGKKNDWIQTLTVCKDGGIFFAGFTNSEELDGSKSKHNGDAWFIRLNAEGKVLWEKIIKETYEDNVNRVIETRSGFFVIAGSSFVENASRQFWLVKLSPDGDVILDKKWGNAGFEELVSVRECADGGYILSGYSIYNFLPTPYHKGKRDFWLFKTTTEGELVWQQTFGGPSDEIGADALEIKPHLFYGLATKENHFNPKRTSSGDDVWLIRVEELPCTAIKPAFITNLPEDKTKITTQVGKAVKFINRSSYGDRWLWEFGDGSTSTEKSPSHIYNKKGRFVVKLTVFQNLNCKETFVTPKFIVVQ